MEDLDFLKRLKEKWKNENYKRGLACWGRQVGIFETDEEAKEILKKIEKRLEAIED